MSITLLHFCLAVLLFYAVNWIGRGSSEYGYLQLSLFARTDQAPAFNFVLKTFTPTVFIIIVAAACYGLNLGEFVPRIWLVSVYYFGFRLLYNLLLGRALLLNWISTLAQTSVGMGAAYLSYLHLILPRRSLFPDPERIGNQVWIIVALFLYAVFNSILTSIEPSIKRKNRYVRSRFSALRRSYGDLIRDQFPKRYMELVAYAILIHETFNRPWIARAVERALFPWASHTIGPMQVRTDKRLSDRESVRVGVRQLKEHFVTTMQEQSGKSATRYEKIKLALAKYNRDETYIGECLELLHTLWAQIAPEYRNEFERMYYRDSSQDTHEASQQVPK